MTVTFPKVGSFSLVWFNTMAGGISTIGKNVADSSMELQNESEREYFPSEY